jgi:hypothetical protein
MGNLDDVASTSKAAELQVSRTSHEQQPAINLYTLRESVLANAETNALGKRSFIFPPSDRMFKRNDPLLHALAI